MILKSYKVADKIADSLHEYINGLSKMVRYIMERFD